MIRLTSFLLTFFIGIGMSSAVSADAYIRGASAPWGVSTNETAMETVFGNGGWADLRMADGAGPFTPGTHDFIFLEGGDGTANELSAYLAANQAAIEAYVTAGGNLLLNSAPNEGGDIAYGFGGVTLTYPSFSDTVTAANPGHPVFQGPCVPVDTDYTGNWFGHAIVGGGISSIILGVGGDPDGETILGEMDFGSGKVLFGGMTTDNWHDPQPEASNLTANIIAYTAGRGADGCELIAVPSLNIWGLAILAALMLLIGFGVRRGLVQLKR